VGAKISRATQKQLAGLGHDPEEIILVLQRSLLQGDLTIPDNITKNSFADGT
jgi:hypothetical protein